MQLQLLLALNLTNHPLVIRIENLQSADLGRTVHQTALDPLLHTRSANSDPAHRATRFDTQHDRDATPGRACVT